MYSPLVTVSSPPKGRFGIRVLFVLGGNHFRLIFVVGMKKHQLMTSGFVTWCERGTWQKLAATMEPVWDGVSRQILLRPRGVSGGLHGNQEPGTWDPGVWSCILVGGGGRCSPEQSTPCSASVTTPPHYLICWCPWVQNLRRPAHRETKAEKSTKRRLCTCHPPVLPPDGQSVEMMGGARAHPFFPAEFSHFSWKLLRRSCFFPNHFIKVVWCRLFQANQSW